MFRTDFHLEYHHWQRYGTITKWILYCHGMGVVVWLHVGAFCKVYWPFLWIASWHYNPLYYCSFFVTRYIAFSSLSNIFNFHSVSVKYSWLLFFYSTNYLSALTSYLIIGCNIGSLFCGMKDIYMYVYIWANGIFPVGQISLCNIWLLDSFIYRCIILNTEACGKCTVVIRILFIFCH